MANILEGITVVEHLRNELLALRSTIKGKVGLASLRLAGDGATDSYINSQKRWAKDLDVKHKIIELDNNLNLDQVIKKIDKVNQDNSIQGIILHKPLPESWDKGILFKSILASKDVEGINPLNLGEIVTGNYKFVPPTVLSVLELIKTTKVELAGKNVTIVGFSSIFGKPLSMILADKLATVSIAHIGTDRAGKLADYVKEADVLISAVGKPDLIKGHWIKPQAIVIDVGISKKEGKIVGDVEFGKACQNAAFISPVPGGVGVLTVAFLFKNLLKAALK